MSARTLAVPLPSPASSAQFQLDPNIKLRVESVFVTIDNSGGGDIKPLLTVSDQNTQEVAAKRQGETIPAGDTGSATWALRLTDEGSSSGANALSVGIVLLCMDDLSGNVVSQSQTISGVPNPSFIHFQADTGLTWHLPPNGTISIEFDNTAPRNVLARLNAQYIVDASTGAHEVLNFGAAATVAPGASAFLEFGTHHSGAVLLDATVPTLPKATGAGTYAFATEVELLLL